jgi:2'-5' RNA ligase
MDTVKFGPSQRARLAAVVRSFRGLELRFQGVGRFAEVLWLAPEPDGALVEMIRAIVEACPAYQPYGGQFDSIVPHVTVAHGAGLDLGALEPELKGRFAHPVSQRIDAVSMFSTVRRRWREADRFLLG